MTSERPDPETLLARAKEEEARKTRGRLKLFFGAAAGVGKTFAMLEAARELKADGVDVVVGFVETHGRADTATQLAGLEVLPRRSLTLPGGSANSVCARENPRGRPRPSQRSWISSPN